ncbi:MAG TPA: hypothetical protein VFN42_07170 [Acetobacteraceae bacterium]|nr:hypothetical protein [Acetobacteraceae bacterium]
MFSVRSWAFGVAVLAALGVLAAAGPAKADWGHHRGWHGGWHHGGWYRWGPPAVVVAPRAYYYAPPPVVYAPPPVYYAPPPAYYPPGVSFGVTFH